MQDFQVEEDTSRQPPESQTDEKMKSGLFLVLHTIVNTVMLSSCAIYISVTKNLSVSSDNALILPQILAVIPGCFFTLARSVLLVDTRFIPEKMWHCIRYFLAIILGIIAYGSLIPAIFWSLLWKLITVFDEDIKDADLDLD